MSLPWNEPISTITPLEIIYMYLIWIFGWVIIMILIGYKSHKDLLEEIREELKEIRQLLNGELQLSAKNVVVHVNDTLSEYDTEEYK